MESELGDVQAEFFCVLSAGDFAIAGQCATNTSLNLVSLVHICLSPPLNLVMG